MIIFKGVFLPTADMNENFACEPLVESAWSGIIFELLVESAWSGIILSALNHTSVTYWLCDFGHKS